jgi:RNA-binding protein 39
MQKLARIEPAPKPQLVYVYPTIPSTHFTIICSNKPNIPQAMQSRSVLLKNMFDPEE